MKKSLILITLIISLISCEDPVPSDYIEKIYVEAYLIVDEPIKDIYIGKTQPVLDSFDYEKARYSGLDVYILEGSNKFKLDYNGRYYYYDTSYKVKENTKYKIEISTGDGKFIYGETITPKRFKWITPPKDIVFFPKDSLNLPTEDSLSLEWESVTPYYVIMIKCLDTLNYGKYLQPPTEEMNRRIVFFRENERRYKDVTSVSFIPTDKTRFLWNFFKWYGLQEITIFNPDLNFLEWNLQYAVSAAYDSRLGSIKGDGIGVFGSASVIRDTLFLVKNQP